MAKKKFGGDREFRLPEKQVEPYRLWFWALQLAHRTPGLKINKRFYRDWGDVAETDFSSWWHEKWRDLFAVSIGVHEIETEDDFTRFKGGKSVILRVPLDQPFETTKKQLQLTLEGRIQKGAAAKQKGRFALEGASRMKVTGIRGYLWMYHFNLETGGIAETAAKYVDWAESWKNRKRPKYVPGGLHEMVNEYRQGSTVTADPAYDSAKRSIRRGRKIVKNVAGGEFPGKYQ